MNSYHYNLRYLTFTLTAKYNTAFPYFCCFQSKLTHLNWPFHPFSLVFPNGFQNSLHIPQPSINTWNTSKGARLIDIHLTWNRKRIHICRLAILYKCTYRYWLIRAFGAFARSTQCEEELSFQGWLMSQAFHNTLYVNKAKFKHLIRIVWETSRKIACA